MSPDDLGELLISGQLSFMLARKMQTSAAQKVSRGFLRMVYGSKRDTTFAIGEVGGGMSTTFSRGRNPAEFNGLNFSKKISFYYLLFVTHKVFWILGFFDPNSPNNCSKCNNNILRIFKKPKNYYKIKVGNHPGLEL